MLGACLRLGGLLVDHPFKGVGGFVQLRAARAGVPVVVVIGMPAGVVRGVFRTQDKVKGAFFLDIIIQQRMSVLQLFPSENQPLLIGRNPFFLLYLALYVIDRVCRLYLERDGLACERFYKNLHGKSRG